MKLRINFVSNSSSSSYICDICGDEYSGWDACLDDAGMVECKCGHIFCEGHMEDDVVEKRKEQYIKELIEKYNYTYEEAESEDGEIRYGIPSEFCPICQLKEIIDSDLAAYTLYKLGITREVAEEMFRSEFKNLEAFEKRDVND